MNSPDVVPVGRAAVQAAPFSSRFACWFWGWVALSVGIALLGIFTYSRVGVDREPQPLLFRLLVEGWIILNAQGMRDIPGLTGNPRLLSYYLNRDFGDGFLIASSVVALVFTSVSWMAAYGLGRGDRWARIFFIALTLTTDAVTGLYGIYYLAGGGPPVGLALIATAALVPVALAVDLIRRRGLPEAKRRNPLTSSFLLVILSAHAVLVVPALACAGVILGIFLRWTWLTWVS